MENKHKLELTADIAGRQPLVLFDGECSLCSSSVLFLLRHNRSGNLSFVSLQSEIGSGIMLMGSKTFQQTDTLLLLQDNKLYGYSTAALKIAAHLSFPLRLLKFLIVVPPFIRDFLYRIIAENRYRWFGRESCCIADDQAYQKRFLR